MVPDDAAIPGVADPDVPNVAAAAGPDGGGRADPMDGDRADSTGGDSNAAADGGVSDGGVSDGGGAGRAADSVTAMRLDDVLAAEDDPRRWGGRGEETAPEHDRWLRDQRPPHWG
ncbi:hypothetical protein [Tersicoccus solisilvae]|uniref:hypothetical protein n=1 Tax=Tersicoccus solisilvae TaxID=1882339 RepID=UPI001664A9C9|nr:hypothetical protein [Tersicoccus solisilvae]